VIDFSSPGFQQGMAATAEDKKIFLALPGATESRID